MSITNELIIQAVPAFQDLDTEYNPNSMEIQNGINSLRLIIQKIFSSELDEQDGAEIVNLKNKLIEAIPISKRLVETFPMFKQVAILKRGEICFLGSQYISACNCSLKVDFDHRRSFTSLVLRKVQEVFNGQIHFRVASLGSGRCYQELMLHSAFLMKKYTETK